ncbi:hypothetical protein WBG78_08885 [Chryseolinea sp. T2]|uniref:hypothetical protein n=1 Tax=Chryseolinea sp. T2 TaxID=3129255 RepID=UPI003076DA59
MSRRIAVLLGALVITSSALAQVKDGANKQIEKIRGAWKVEKVLSGKTEVARNPTSGQWIEFRNDGRYVNHTTSIDSGSFRLNENDSRLYLESQLQPDDAKIVEWEIVLTNNSLTMSPVSTGGNKKASKDKMKYVYVRIDKGSATVNN